MRSHCSTARRYGRTKKVVVIGFAIAIQDICDTSTTVMGPGFAPTTMVVKKNMIGTQERMSGAKANAMSALFSSACIRRVLSRIIDVATRSFLRTAYSQKTITEATMMPARLNIPT
ncbi:hypothetical protein AAVH_17370 [Aphelenchoides avenae]|nr:hypothetical protein AAVH_17370 [Aphelenchus avenae]